MATTTLAYATGASNTHVKVELLSDQFVDMKFMTALTTLSDKWFYKLIQEGRFPKPIKFGRKSLWLKSEVELWLQLRIEESRR
ncbi:helix-turn-helix transcriptional regulator [Paenalcaligenes sp. Me131]|uniref:helix-turn-helix transcriptional regulator n=1 Tax=Paenalcaligenes sp. Me131 TaxID=3392636 RepID=UPI003D2AB91A